MCSRKLSIQIAVSFYLTNGIFNIHECPIYYLYQYQDIFPISCFRYFVMNINHQFIMNPFLLIISGRWIFLLEPIVIKSFIQRKPAMGDTRLAHGHRWCFRRRRAPPAGGSLSTTNLSPRGPPTSLTSPTCPMMLMRAPSQNYLQDLR